MRFETRLVAHDIKHHGHPARQVPQHVTVEKPSPWVVGAEPQHGVTAARDLDRVPKNGAGEIVRINGRLSG